MRYICDDCERRAQLEHEAKFGTYLERLRAQRREREARQLEEQASGEPKRCVICDDALTPPRSRVCEKVACIRTYKAEYQRRRFGRATKTDGGQDSAPPKAAPELDLFA